MQLDLFAHSHDVMLRNAAIAALTERDIAATTRAIDHFAADYPGDSILPALTLLRDRLAMSVIGPLDRATAGVIFRATESAIEAARRVFERNATNWLSPLWVELAQASIGLPFDAGDELVHAVPFLLRAEKWAEANACIERIPSWRRQPLPLAWKIEASARIAGVDLLWPLVAELAWMAAPRAEALMTRLNLTELPALVDGFNGEFDGDGAANEFAWFPAWLLIAQPHLADAMRAAQAGANTAPERCARLVLSLLGLERQGRHHALIENRKKLRDAHPELFQRYMRSRANSAIR